MKPIIKKKFICISKKQKNITMITKQIAATLFAHGFRLVDKEGNRHEIACVNYKGMLLKNIDLPVDDIIVIFSQIGTDYWILKRPYSQLESSEIMELFWIEYGGGVSEEGKAQWLRDFIDNILYSPMEKLPYDMVIKLYSLHFIDLPEGTYQEME